MESSPIDELSPFAGQQLNADAVVGLLAVVVTVAVPDWVTVALGLKPVAIVPDWANDDDDWGTVILLKCRSYLCDTQTAPSQASAESSDLGYFDNCLPNQRAKQNLRSQHCLFSPAMFRAARNRWEACSNPFYTFFPCRTNNIHVSPPLLLSSSIAFTEALLRCGPSVALFVLV